MTRNSIQRIAPLTLIVLALLFSGCGSKTEKGSQTRAADKRDPGVQVAIVPGADLIFHLDLSAMRDTPIMQAIKEKRAATGKTAPARMNEADWSMIKDLTGLSEEDMLSVLFSADLDTFDIDSRSVAKEFKDIQGAWAVSLAKPLPYAKVLESMQVMSSRSPKTRLEELELAGRPAVRVFPTSPVEPVVHASVSASEKTLLVAFSEEQMLGLLQRDSEGQPLTPDPNLVRLGTTIADGTQFRVLILASDAMREKISASVGAMADANPQERQTQMGILAGFLSPLRNTKNLVLTAKAGGTLDIRMAIELGNASEAQQCAHLIQSFIVPMLTKSFETTDPENKIRVDDTLNVVNEDSSLVFSCQVAEQDIESWQQPGG